MRVEFVFDLNYEYFSGSATERRILKAVAIASGASLDDLQVTSIQRGCVKIVIEMDRYAAEKLLNAIEAYRLRDVEGYEGLFANLAADQISAVSTIVDDMKLMFPPEAEETSSDVQISTAKKIADEPKKNLIFFVHGWLGGETSFGNLPVYLAQLTGCRCESFIYPTGFLEHSHSMSYIARSLDNWIRNELHGNDAQFAIISHSMGGVIVRDFLGGQVISHRPLDDRIRQATFIASPQTGAWLGKVAGLLPSTAAAQVAELSPNSRYLGTTNATWNSWVSRRIHLAGNVRSIFSPTDEVVDHVSAMGADPEAVPILDANHTSIIKPKTENDEIVRTLARFIDEAGLSIENPLDDLLKTAGTSG